MKQVPKLNRTNLLLLSSSLFSLTSAYATKPKSVDAPNIVYILCDDLGYGDVHCLNPERCKISTPNMDRLREEGMAFTDCHSSSSVSTPSRYSVLTGRYAWRTDLQNGVLNGEGKPLIAPDRMTVGNMLQKQGYTTAVIGKWHLGLDYDKIDFAKPIADGPVQHGFDYFFGIAGSANMQPFVYMENDHFTQVPTKKKTFPTFVYGPIPVTKSTQTGPAASDYDVIDLVPKITGKAVDYIDERAKEKKPFFLYLSLTSPHCPLVPTKEWQGKSGLGQYGDFVMETDWAIGEVLKAIDAAGFAENTMVVLTSDNGCAPYVGVHKLEEMGHYPSGEFRGYKSDIWEGGHRVPFIVRWPAKVKAGSESNQISCMTNLMATCADILDVKLPDTASEDSYSILPTLLGKKRTKDEIIVNHSINGRFGIRKGKWKLELCPASGGWGTPNDAAAVKDGSPTIQLYNIKNDIAEKLNESAKNQKVVKKLTSLLEKYVADGRSTKGEALKNDVEVDIWKMQLNEPAKGKKEKEDE